MNQTKKQEPTIVYVKQRSGNVINPNLDDLSLASLLETQAIHKERGNHFSQSVLMRRAVRLYNQYVKQLTNWERELVEIRRAAKGVL